MFAREARRQCINQWPCNMHKNLQRNKVLLSMGIFSTILTNKHGNNADNTASSLCRGLYALNHRDYYLHTLHCLTKLTSLTYLCTKSVSSYWCSIPSTHVSLRTEHRDKFPGLNNIRRQKEQESALVYSNYDTTFLKQSEERRMRMTERDNTANPFLKRHPTLQRELKGWK